MKSCLLERKAWRGANDPVKVDLAQRQACKAVAKFVVLIDGQVIRHPGISFCRDDLYRRDAMHLSELGMDVWLQDIHCVLEEWLQA